MKYILLISLLVIIFFNCKDIKQNEGDAKDNQDRLKQEISTARTSTGKSCFTVCDTSKSPDLRLITNVTQNPPLIDGVNDSNSYFWKNYHVRVNPIRLTQNYLSPGSYTIRYGWDSGVVVNRVQLQCLVENIAPFNCANDWVFDESQGYLVGSNYYFDGLFSFDTYERGKGNNWKFLYQDFKKEFFPSVRIATPYLFETFCYYERAIPAQTGDFYNNYFRLPNHDGLYKIVVKFNPLIKGCNAVEETNYTNNEETILLEIKEGSITIKK